MRADAERGFSLVELVVVLGITLTVVAAIFELVEQSRRRFAAEPDVVDRQQRVRVAVDVLARDLQTAHAVLPYRLSGPSPDPPGTFKNDEATIVGGPQPGLGYTARTYFIRRDASGSHLARVDGDGNAVPVVAGVTSLAFDYFGDVAAGGADAERCTPADGGPALVPIAGGEFIDGPWCPGSPGEPEFDADLLRIRKVAVRFRLAAEETNAELRFEIAPRNRNHGR